MRKVAAATGHEILSILRTWCHTGVHTIDLCAFFFVLCGTNSFEVMSLKLAAHVMHSEAFTPERGGDDTK